MYICKQDHEVSICSLIPPAMAISIARTTKGNNSKEPGPMALIFFPRIQLYLSCVQNFKFLGRVVPEISLIQNKWQQTDRHTEKTKNYIPPLHTSYAGCIITALTAQSL